MYAYLVAALLLIALVVAARGRAPPAVALPVAGGGLAEPLRRAGYDVYAGAPPAEQLAGVTQETFKNWGAAKVACDRDPTCFAIVAGPGVLQGAFAGAVQAGAPDFTVLRHPDGAGRPRPTLLEGATSYALKIAK